MCPTHYHRRHTSLIWLTMLVVGLSVILAGCGGRTATPVAHAPTATATPLPPTNTPSPTDTPAPTDTLVPTNTATPVPTNTPTPVEPTATETAANNIPSFAADVQPIFTERCIKCHIGDNAPRGLRLDSYDSVIAGGTYRPVIEAGSPADSQLFKRITGETAPRMPFDGPPFLDDDQIALIMAWIEAGAPDN